MGAGGGGWSLNMFHWVPTLLSASAVVLNIWSARRFPNASMIVSSHEIKQIMNKTYDESERRFNRNKVI